MVAWSFLALLAATGALGKKQAEDSTHLDHELDNAMEPPSDPHRLLSEPAPTSAPSTPATILTVYNETDLWDALWVFNYLYEIEPAPAVDGVVFRSNITMNKYENGGASPYNFVYLKDLKHFRIDGAGFELSSSGDRDATAGVYADNVTELTVVDLTLRGFACTETGAGIFVLYGDLYLSNVRIMDSACAGLILLQANLVFNSGSVQGCYLSSSVFF